MTLPWRGLGGSKGNRLLNNLKFLIQEVVLTLKLLQQ